MTRSTFLNLLVIIVAVAFAAVVAVPAQETINDYGDPRNPEVLARLIADAPESFVLIDVRSAAEYQSGHIPGARNIDYREIETAMSDIDRMTHVVVYCQTGNRSGEAERTLRRLSFTRVFDFGGIGRWPDALQQEQ